MRALLRVCGGRWGRGGVEFLPAVLERRAGSEDPRPTDILPYALGYEGVAVVLAPGQLLGRGDLDPQVVSEALPDGIASLARIAGEQSHGTAPPLGIGFDQLCQPVGIEGGFSPHDVARGAMHVDSVFARELPQLARRAAQGRVALQVVGT